MSANPFTFGNPIRNPARFYGRVEDIRQIVNLELDKVAVRLEDYNITLKASDSALKLLAEEGYDPDMGARPLRRVIQQKVEDKLSDALLAKEFDEGNAILIDTNDDNEIILRQDESAPTEPEKAMGINA